MDDRDFEQPDRAECLVCRGSGSVRVILGDDEQQERCWSCAGTGLQLSRDELCDALSQADGSQDLRLVEDLEEMPSYANHAEEIAAFLADYHRRFA